MHVATPLGSEEMEELFIPDNSKHESDAKATVGGSIVNITNNVMGSGVVALAFSMKEVRTRVSCFCSVHSSQVFVFSC